MIGIRTKLRDYTDRAMAAPGAVRAGGTSRRLRRARPALAPSSVQTGAIEALLRPAYDDYVSSVSTAGMAASLETSVYLYHLCRAARPDRVLDLGSGFSSYVLRRYASEAPTLVAVVSVDDNEEWLTKTADFLRAQNTPDNGLDTWDSFRGQTPEPFGVILHDIAGGALRDAAMPVAVDRLAPQGLIIFDDTHHKGHRRAAVRIAADRDLALFNLRPWTLDRFGRYALLGCR